MFWLRHSALQTLGVSKRAEALACENSSTCWKLKVDYKCDIEEDDHRTNLDDVVFVEKDASDGALPLASVLQDHIHILVQRVKLSSALRPATGTHTEASMAGQLSRTCGSARPVHSACCCLMLSDQAHLLAVSVPPAAAAAAPPLAPAPVQQAGHAEVSAIAPSAMQRRAQFDTSCTKFLQQHSWHGATQA